MNNSDFGKCLLVFLGGAAVGAAAGILLAPDKGKNTRKKIARTAQDLTRSVEEKIEDMKESVSDLMDDIKEAAECLTHEAEKGIHHSKN